MLQVRMITTKALAEEAERAKANDAMLTSDVAKPIGLLSGTKVGGTRKPRTSGASSECVSYHLDADGNKVNAHIFRGSERRHNRSNTQIVETLKSRKLTAADLAPLFCD